MAAFTPAITVAACNATSGSNESPASRRGPVDDRRDGVRIIQIENTIGAVNIRGQDTETTELRLAVTVPLEGHSAMHRFH